MSLADALKRFEERARTDAGFRAEFEQDPATVFQRETGFTLDAAFDSGLELSDETLFALSGGRYKHVRLKELREERRRRQQQEQQG